jgi:hypothetical protein
MQAWSHADMLGDQSYFMNGLLTCLDDEEEEMVTTNKNSLFNVSVYTSLSSLLNLNIALSNFFTFLFLG